MLLPPLLSWSSGATTVPWCCGDVVRAPASPHGAAPAFLGQDAVPITLGKSHPIDPNPVRSSPKGHPNFAQPLGTKYCSLLGLGGRCRRQVQPQGLHLSGSRLGGSLCAHNAAQPSCCEAQASDCSPGHIFRGSQESSNPSGWSLA